MAYSNTGPWCDVKGAPRKSVGYTFNLALLNLPEMFGGTDVPWMPPFGESRWASCGASACGGSVSMGLDRMVEGGGTGPLDHAHYPQLSDDEFAALAEWAGGVPGNYSWVAFIFVATASVGMGPGMQASVYKAFGYYFYAPTPNTWDWREIWVGDTEWILAGSLTFDNLQCKLNTTDHWSQKFAFRHWSHRSANYGLFTSEDETVSVATIGGASVSRTAEYDEETSPAFSAGINQPWTPALNRDYAQVQDVSSAIGDVKLDLAMSLWSQPYDSISSAPNWIMSLEQPEGPDNWPWGWHFFTTGSTFRMHRVEGGYWGPDEEHIYGTATATVYGPVCFDIQAGRGGYVDNEDAFPLPDGFLVDVGLRHWISETETEIVWLPPGTSRYYTFCLVGIWYNAPATSIKTGTYHFGNVTPTIKEEWLRDNHDLMAYQGHDEDGNPYGGEISNRNCWIALPSLEADPSITQPYWGHALEYVWAEVSIDIPPGYDERPTAWAAGADAAVGPDDNGKWTVTGETGKITRTLASRFDARMNYLAAVWDVGMPAYDRDWPILAKANHQLDADPPDVAAVCEVEDVTNYDNSRILRFSFKEDKYPEDIDWAKARLHLTFALYDFRDEWYLQPAYNGWNRFGANGWFECDTSDAEFTFNGFGDKLAENQKPTRHLYFDLAELRRNDSVNLRHVRSVELILPTLGEYELEDARLIEDPSTHGEERYPHLTPQQGTNPWNWEKCGTGWASTFEGMPHLNIPNGSETYFSKDTQLGIKGLQYWQYNPLWLADQEEPPEPFDPTTAWNLQRLVAVLGLQEQLTGTYLHTPNVAKATSDEHGNSLGFLYFWDLNRPFSDCGDRRAAITVGTLEAFGITCPLIPLCANIRWSTHGRGQGMAYQNEQFLRMDGGAWDDADEGNAQIFRRPIDAEGNVVKDGNGDPMPWEVCGSFTPDVTSRFVTPPLHESGYEYKTNTWGPGRFVTREYQYVTALFSWGRPILAITTHHVAGAELVGDVSMSPDGPGHTKLQRGSDGLQWSKRFPMADGQDYRWGNILACTDRTEYVLEDGADTYLRQAKSLDGKYLHSYKVAEGYLRPFVVEVQNRLLLTAVKDGKAYLVALAKEPPHTMVGDPVEIGPADPKGATCLAYCQPQGLLFAAVEKTEGEHPDTPPTTYLYSSTSRGAEWQDAKQTAPLAFPYLYGDGATLWLVGFDATKTAGAQGLAKMRKFFAAPILAAPQVSAMVGPADRGRPAIIRREVGGELIVAAGKVTTWDEELPTPAIIEYRSIDSGQKWNQRQAHRLI